MSSKERSDNKKRRIRVRAYAFCFGVIVAYLVAELALQLTNWPRVYHARSTPEQFQIRSTLVEGEIFYRNLPNSKIRFVYDGNLRGYFGFENEVDHSTNSDGFRGSEFSRKKDSGSKRLLFLGDSFTFGEGVRDSDTYAKVSERLLQKSGADGFRKCESYNLGVGGYNTTQSLIMLKEFGLHLRPDMIVLGYVPNDAEPPIFEFDRNSGDLWRREREIESLMLPTDKPYYGIRIWSLVSSFFSERTRMNKVIEYYRSISQDSDTGQQASLRALRELADLCKQEKIPCYVLHFPLLFQLSDYPLRASHRKIAAAVNHAGMIYIDLLPELVQRDAETLWVHPTDQHPNEVVHRLAARLLVENITRK